MLKEMMYKIFPKLLAKAISDEQEHNQKQQEEISILHSYSQRLQNNFNKYCPQIEVSMRDNTEVEIVESFTVPENGIYSIIMTASFQFTGSGFITLTTMANATRLDVNSANIDASVRRVLNMQVVSIRSFSAGDVITVIGHSRNVTSCESQGGKSGMYVQRLN